MSTIQACGKQFTVREYETRPITFSRLLGLAKERDGHAICQCTVPAPKLVIRTKRTTNGTRHSLATWPNQGHAHDPSCSFFVSDVDYLEAEALRDLKESLAAEKLRLRLTTITGILDYLIPAAAAQMTTATQNWADVVVRVQSMLAKADHDVFPLAKRIYVVPAFQKNHKEAIEAGWQRFVGEVKNSEPGPLLILAEIKTVETLEGSVITHLRHHRTALFMSKDLAARLASDFPAVERTLGDADDAGRVLGLFQAAMTRRENLWVSDAALVPVSAQYAALV